MCHSSVQSEPRTPGGRRTSMFAQCVNVINTDCMDIKSEHIQQLIGDRTKQDSPETFSLALEMCEPQTTR